MTKKVLFIGTFIMLFILAVLAFLLPELWSGRTMARPPVQPIASTAVGGEGELEAETETLLDVNYVYYEGRAYSYNYDLYNILFMGVDKTDPVRAKEVVGMAGQADSIILLSIDKAGKTIRMLTISRDTMTNIDIYDTVGRPFATYYGQLALQHSFALGGKSSAWAMKRTVSGVLFNLPIDACFALDIEGLPIINDALGGVEVRFSQDYTDIDGRFQAGEAIILDGEMAEKFIRKRDVLVSGSNKARMERQTEYILAFFNTLNEKKQDGRFLPEEVVQKAEMYITTDILFDQLPDFNDFSYSIEEITAIQGEIIQGEVYEEFYVDDKALKKQLIEMFYEPVS